MVRCRTLVQLNSNNVLVVFNVGTAALAAGVVAAAAWLATKSHKDCLSFLHWPFMAVGLLIIGVAALGAWAASCRHLAALGAYGAAILALVLAFAGLTLFAVIVTAGSGGGVRPLPPARFREYATSDFSPWLRSRVRPPHWTPVQVCLTRSRLCSDLASRYKSLRQLYSADLSPTQVGCCKPPSICSFSFVNATGWVHALHINASNDCRLWSNQPTQFCFTCDSCRAGEIQVVRHHWINVAIVSLVTLLLLLFLLILTCVALYTAKHRTIPDEQKVINPNI